MSKRSFTSSDFTVTFNGVPLEASTNHFPSYYPETIDGTLTFDFTDEDCDKIYNIAQEVVDSMGIPSKMLETPESSTATEMGTLCKQVGIHCQENTPPEKVIHYCPYGDSGWCYYRGDCETTAKGGACNSPQTCEVNTNGK